MNDIKKSASDPGELFPTPGYDFYDVDFERLQQVSRLYKIVITFITVY